MTIRGWRGDNSLAATIHMYGKGATPNEFWLYAPGESKKRFDRAKAIEVRILLFLTLMNLTTLTGFLIFLASYKTKTMTVICTIGTQ